MKQMMLLLATVLMTICLSPFSVEAGDFDGTKPLLCCATKVFECVEREGCMEVSPEQVNLPRFMDIDFAGKYRYLRQFDHSPVAGGI